MKSLFFEKILSYFKGECDVDLIFGDECSWFVPSNKICKNWLLMILLNVGIIRYTNWYFRYFSF